MTINRKFIRFIALFLATELLFTTVLPTISWALTAGPKSPEFSSFTPVATTDMVNLFTGDFNYNLPVIEIPGSEGGGYALSLAYNSGVTSEEESSWVGFGWSLNPGAISRSVRGFPDDYDGNTVDYYNKTRPNWTASMGHNAGIEAFSKDDAAIAGISISSSLRFNNYQGYYKSLGVGLTAKGMASLNVNFDNDGVTFSAAINPFKILNVTPYKTFGLAADVIKNEETKPHGKYALSGRANENASSGSMYGLNTFLDNVRPTTFSQYSGIGFNWSVSGQINPPIPVGFQVGMMGAFNTQFNKYKNALDAYGYLNSDKATASGVMDYYVEKGSAFDKRDYYIGMPFNNHDVFHLMGEGLSGGFRAFNSQIGHYKPNEAESKIKIRQMGFEFMVGANLGVGLDIGIGSQTTKIDDWKVPNRGSFANSDDPSGNMFRFNQDSGGKVSYTNYSELETAHVDLMNPVFGFRTTQAIAPVADETRNGAFKIGAENGRSSFIEQGYTSNGTGKNLTSFSIYNEDGFRYSYDEPVYIRNETNLSVDISKNDQVEWRYLAFRDLKLSDGGSGYEITDSDLNSPAFSTAVGDIKKDEFVNTFLMTSICTPDYVDKTDNGPSQDDFGGWTKFNYRKIYGKGQGQWYRYRTPYNGLLYQQNSLSDTKDDIGSVTTGEKEVVYLDRIETKTHVAYFVTNKSTSGVEFLNGSGDQRLDGLGAPAVVTEDPASKKSTNGKPYQGTTELEYLEKIVLYAKDKAGQPIHTKPLKVVRFAYDYSLVPNVPNNLNSTYTFSDNSSNNTSANIGKLTLRKVWFEYGGAVNAKISPYEFDYAYKHSSEVGEELAHVFSEYDVLADNVQNPSYSPHLLSPWGYPMANGKERKENDIPWIDQSFYLGNQQNFDPAAWHLKSVKLPSGGEIIVQYEEDDYTHVQNRSAMAMASFASNGVETGYNSDPEYFINPEDLGADPNDVAQVQGLADKINAHFLDEDGQPTDKIYFKFLYALKGTNPSLDDCRSDYLTGYANFLAASVRQTGGKNVIAIILSGGSGDRTPIPRTACFELVSNQKQGKLDNVDCEEPKYERMFDRAMAAAADDSQAELVNNSELDKQQIKQIKKIAKLNLYQMAVDPQTLFYDVDDKNDVCKVISPEHSFFKLPVFSAKKGGGVRVKKLLMYDPGIESGDEAVYGSEYLYRLEDGVTSSGVATTEPGPAREENPLVTFLPKKRQKAFSRLTTGEDKEQMEGPLGESILPMASVGYSRVIVKNIHSGQTGTGFSVTEYYTVKDYYFDRYYGAVTEADKDKFDVSGKGLRHTNLDDEKVFDFMKIPAGLFTFETSKIWTAQGFRFIINNMHGQLKKVSNYGGTYVDSVTDGYEVSYQDYTYYEPGEKVKMLEWDQATGTYKEYYDTPGKEMDIAMEARRLKDTNVDFTIELDISVTISFFPPIFVTIEPTYEHATKTIATHATTKVLRYPAILKSVKSSQDGITSTTENIAFSKATGAPILTKTADSFDKLYLAGSAKPHNGAMYSLSIPAEWMYTSMGQKAVNASNTNQLSAQTATFNIYGVEPDPNWFSNPMNLLSASVTTFSNNWSSSWTDPKIDSEYNSSGYQTQLNKVWRPASSWVYKSDGETSSASKKIYESGYFNMSSMFNWVDPNSQSDNNWIMATEITKYSPNGNILEEVNALKIPSAVVFGKQYGNHLPVMVAQNAAYNNIYFEDFENSANDNVVSHSGSVSKQISYNETIVSGLLATPHLADDGAVLNIWLNFGSGAEEQGLQADVNGNIHDLQRVARTGEWTLYKAELPGSLFAGIGVNNPFTVKLRSSNGSFSQQLNIDDVRFQPFDSEASCYVYDHKNFRLIAQFDSQHFGLYYQYNEEGQLIRKMIETEKGLKTIQETQYNIAKKTR